MATAKKTQIVITANAATAKKVMDELQQRIEQIKAKMQTLDVTTKQGQKDFKALEKELVSYNSAVAQNVSNTERIDKAMKNLSGTSLNELKRALSVAKSELGKMSANSAGLKQMQGNVKAIQNQIDQLTQSTHKQGGAWQTAMKNLSAYVGMFAVFNKAKELMTGIVKGNFEMSDALTDIRKVSGLLTQDINKMAVSLSKIDTRTAMSELNAIAYSGAKLGIGEYGADALEGFVKASNQVNVALKEDLGEEALTALAKITQVMGLIPKMGVEQSMLKTGSAIFKLASTTTATSNQIVEFSNRLLSMGKTGALTTSDILALGAAVDSMAMEPEVASTAFSKLITEMRKGTSDIEGTLGIAKGTLKGLLEQGKGMEALLTIFRKMHDEGNVFGLDGLFKDLGSDGARLVKVMVTMADKVDMLETCVNTANDAFTEGTAVTNEYNMQQETAQGILERANNLWNKAFVNPDGVDLVKDLAKAWYDVSKAITGSESAHSVVQGTLTALVWSAKTLVNLLPGIFGYLVGAAMTRLVAGIMQIKTAITEVIVAKKAMDVAMASNIIGAVTSAFFLLYTTISQFVNKANEAAESVDGFTKSLRAAKGEQAKANMELDSYKRAIDKANQGTRERKIAIDNFNKQFGSYLSKLLTETSTAQDLAVAYNEAARAIERKVMMQAKEKDIQQHVAPRAERSAQLLYDYGNQAKSSGNQGFGDKWLKTLVDENIGKKGINGVVNLILDRYGIGNGKGYNDSRRANVRKAVANTNGAPTGSYAYQMTKGGASAVTTFSETEKAAAMAVAYARQYAAQRKATLDVEDKYKNYDLNPIVDRAEGVAVADKPEKKSGSGGSGGGNNRDLRDELKQAQDEAKAVMDNLANYYERQINERTSQLIADGASEAERALRLQPLKDKKDAAMSQARRAIAGKENSWDNTRGSLRGDMIEHDDPDTGFNMSKSLLHDIESVDINALHKKILGLEKALKKAFNSSTAEILGKSTSNEKSILERQAKQAEARRKSAEEHNYMKVVKTNTYDDFNTHGFANPTEEEVSDDTAFEKRKKSIESMYEVARKRIADIYAIDPTSSDGQGILIKLLFGDDTDGMGARIKATLGDDANDWQAFYNKLIQYSDQYTEAEKKTYENAKKIAEQMWAVTQRNINAQRTLTDFQKDASMFGNRTNFASNLGLADNTVDAEVETMRLKMQMAEDYYYFVLQNTKNEQLISEAEKSRQDAELAYATQMATAMKSRLSQMKSLVDPIVTFGESMGEAFATMESDAESADEAIKSAVKSMLKSWGQMLINDVNTQMWKAINDAGVKSAKKKAQPGINDARDKGEAGASADAAARAADTLGTKSNPMWVQMVNGQPVDQNGNPTAAPLSPTGNIVQNPDGSQGIAPTGNQSTGGTFADDYLNNQANTSSLAFKQTGTSGTSKVAAPGASAAANAAGGVGAAMANTAVSGGGITEIGQSAAGAAGNALLDTPFIGGSNKKSDKDNQKENKKEIKEAKKQQTKLTNETEKGVKKRTNVNEEGIKDITDATEQGGEDQSKATEVYQTAMTAAVTTALNTRLAGQKTAATEEIATDAGKEEAKMPLSIAGAVGQCFSSLGPIAGPIMAATVTATLTALLAWALSSAFGSSSSDSSSSSSTNTKLKTGMLTYDSGNVQDLKPFVADDGSMYWAKEEDAPKSGVNLLASPTATTINGQHSLVAENGPELVIGRETTKAMMMNNPSLLKALVNYDSNYSGRRAFDQGNIAETIGAAMQSVQTDNQSSAGSDALTVAVNALMAKLSEPITAQINMYGRDGLHERMQQANQFLKGKH